MTDTTLILLAAIIIILLGYSYIQYKKRKEVVESFSRFFQDLYNSCSSGMSLVKAAKHCKSAKYGSLTPAIRNMCLQIEWGVPFQVALRKLGRNTNDVFVHRLIDFIDKAAVFSPNLGKSMDEIYNHVILTRELEKERSATLFPHLISLYLIYFVLLGTIYILFRFFIPAFGSINMGFYTLIFSHLIIIEAVLSGLVIGKIVEGSFKEGVKHALILLFVGIFFIYFYNIIIW